MAINTSDVKDLINFSIKNNRAGVFAAIHMPPTYNDQKAYDFLYSSYTKNNLRGLYNYLITVELIWNSNNYNQILAIQSKFLSGAEAGSPSFIGNLFNPNTIISNGSSQSNSTSLGYAPATPQQIQSKTAIFAVIAIALIATVIYVLK